MKTKMMLVAGLVVVAGAIIAVTVNMKRPVTPVAAPVAATKPAPSPAPPPQVSIVPITSTPDITIPAPVQPAQPVNSNTVVKAPTRSSPVRASQPLLNNGSGVQDPVAREALSYVGADPDADAYWVNAINDPSLSADERQNLIEDLNEDGLSDPQNPGPQDLPLIIARIRLIEQLAPNAMDQVNADAFAEAYKDLVNMLNGQ